MERRLRIQHPLEGRAEADDVVPGPRTVDSGRGRHELPGVVHGHRTGRRDSRQRRRPARVLRVPPDRAFTGAITWRVRAVRRVAKLQGFITPVNYGPWSQTFTLDEPRDGRRDRPPGRGGDGSRDEHADEREGTRDDAGVRLRRLDVTPTEASTASTGSTSSATSSASTRSSVERSSVALPTPHATRARSSFRPRRRTSRMRPVTILEIGDEGKTLHGGGNPLQVRRARPPAPPAVAAAAGIDPGCVGAPVHRSSRPRTAPGRRSSSSRAAGRTGGSSGRSSPSSSCPSSGRTGRSSATSTSTPRCRRTPAPADASSPSARHPRPSSPARAPRTRQVSLPAGRLIASAGNRPFYGHPLVAWLPAPGADTYEVEWSPTRYPWRTANRIQVDGGTAATLPLKPGKWWYRIRGINSALPDAHQFMSWSAAAPADRREAEVPARRLLEVGRRRVGSGLT